ncbi:MAG: hypothetical protein LAO55_02605 [Acidobacteriia bacterium]|nr:hypothetical protein [Terriglobia bacterium]
MNNVADGDSYIVTLGFPTSITGSGAFNPLAGATLAFLDSTASVNENSFGAVSLTVSADGSFFDFSLLGCVTTGSGCLVGNQLAVNFKIPTAMLNSQNVAAQSIPALTPLDLLEDDGVTDIQGTVDTYSYAGAVSTVPEPSSALLLGCALAGLVAVNRMQMKKEKNV